MHLLRFSRSDWPGIGGDRETNGYVMGLPLRELPSKGSHLEGSGLNDLLLALFHCYF